MKSKGIANNPILHRAASRKGGLRKVKKGFAMNPKLASEAGKKGVVITNAIRSQKSKSEEVSPRDSTEFVDALFRDPDVIEVMKRLADE